MINQMVLITKVWTQSSRDLRDGHVQNRQCSAEKACCGTGLIYAYIRDSLMGKQEAQDAHRDENGVDRCQIRETGGESRQQVG